MRFFKEIIQYWGFAVYAAKSDLSAEVANSYLNWLWWILEPLAGTLDFQELAERWGAGIESF